jgi:hypothetical protein
MAILTEVGGPPAEPLGNLAAELALKFYVVCAMFCTVDNSCPDAHGGAFTAHELLRLEFLIRVRVNLSPKAVLHTTKIGRLALVALIVGAFKNCEFLELAEIHIIGVLHFLILV